jgi:hypothetical protein
MPITTTPSNGPQGEFSTCTPIYSQTLSGAASSITFSNIPTIYTDLLLVCNGGTSSSGQSIYAQFNGDSSTNYSDIVLSGDGTSATSAKSTSLAGIRVVGRFLGTDTSLIDSSITHIMNYSNATTYKTVLNRSSESAGTTLSASAWRSTSPVTSITLVGESSNILSGSTFTIYGIKAAATAPKATGGDQVYTDGTYWYHVFNSSGIFDAKQAITCDYLVVAGGAGAGYLSGGGGAGGYRHFTSQSLTARQYPVVVGAGGAKASVTRTAGANGSNTSFNSVTSTGGGHGSFEDGNANAGLAASSGGSGGGAPVAEPSNAYGAGNAGGYTPVEGYRGGGGTGDRNYNNGAGGGGGSSAVGGNGTTSKGGDGGAGTLNSISGTAVYYATGGGGAFNYNGSSGSGLANLQSGSGGTSSSGTTAGTGNPNTGNGAGGRYNGGTASDSASGGSGIVIVRYAV